MIACKKILLVKQPYLIKLVKFAIHFIIVMAILCCGALVLSRLEDPDIMNDRGDVNVTNEVSKRKEDMNRNETLFWKALESKYGISVTVDLRQELMKEITKYSDQQNNDPLESHGHHSETNLFSDKKFIFMKWFYFMIVSTTTIGYGHVAPQTDNGKLFYIFFSIVGILLMMTLLRSCGKILMDLNEKFYTVICGHLCTEKRYVSDGLMAVVSMCCMFLLFMLLVVWHDKNMTEVQDWKMIDTLYFWMVTFTTVGFGDIHFPLEVEIEHFYELVIYRIFGLSFLAGIIESIYDYINYQKLMLMKANEEKLKRLASLIVKEEVEPLADMLKKEYQYPSNNV